MPTSAFTAAPTPEITATPTAEATPAPTSEPTADPTPSPAPTPTPSPAPTSAPVMSDPIITDTSYQDDRISISISTYTYGSGSSKTTYYVADIRLSSVDYLKTALSSGSLTVNKTSKVADQAKKNGAILAINGDGCGQQRNKGYVVRNGVAYRQTPWKDRDKAEDLVILSDGDFRIIDERYTTSEELRNMGGVLNVFSFGPALIKDGEICVSVGEEISGSKSMNNNPRTAIGMIEPLRYVMVVSDGRTRNSKGLSLYELASVMIDCGCRVAYNLDGGGSSTMWFNGRVINYPTTNGSYSERAVSDIVYIGY